MNGAAIMAAVTLRREIHCLFIVSSELERFGRWGLLWGRACRRAAYPSTDPGWGIRREAHVAQFAAPLQPPAVPLSHRTYASCSRMQHSRLPGPSPHRMLAVHENARAAEDHAMKFGIFYELQLPRPWQPDSDLKLYHNALGQLELADRLGYDYAWEVEHHFLEEYSHSPVPEAFLAAASQRTRKIRLGHGILQLTTTHPCKVAEKVAVLDLLSHGRVEFGMGESVSNTELEPFGRSMEDKQDVFDEAVQAIMPMFRDGGSQHSGKYFNYPLRNVLPK